MSVLGGGGSGRQLNKVLCVIQDTGRLTAGLPEVLPLTLLFTIFIQLSSLKQEVFLFFSCSV